MEEVVLDFPEDSPLVQGALWTADRKGAILDTYWGLGRAADILATVTERSRRLKPE